MRPGVNDVDALIAVVDDDLGRTRVARRRQLGLGLAAVLRERLVIALALHEPRAEPVGEDVQREDSRSLGRWWRRSGPAHPGMPAGACGFSRCESGVLPDPGAPART